MAIDISASPLSTSSGTTVNLEATADPPPLPTNAEYQWIVPAGTVAQPTSKSPKATWDTTDVPPGAYELTVNVLQNKKQTDSKTVPYVLSKEPYGPGDRVPISLPEGREQRPFNVALRRSSIVDTADQGLWNIIRRSCARISFNNYKKFTDFVICDGPEPKNLTPDLKTRWRAQRTAFRRADPFPRRRLPFADVESYRLLKAATEAFLMVNCDVTFDPEQFRNLHLSLVEREERLGLATGDSLTKLMEEYLTGDDNPGPIDDAPDPAFRETIPYLALMRRNVPDVNLTQSAADLARSELCDLILREKLTNPCFLELIWSYWHEEGMLVQTMNAITMRFQNRRGVGDVDPLANLAIDPLRPLNNLIWGFIQDEQHRLTLARRVYEYDHEYGLTLYGRAVPRIRGADTRSKFLEAFHTLLHRASIFYKEDDDTTMIADPFPVLNALRDVHLLLAEGAHNQWGDLPWTARHEMLMQEWLLARPEFRDFLPTRVMVAYPEPWMDRVDAMKRAQGWTDTSVRYFRDLGVFGEQLLLSIRFGNWSDVFDREQAGHWARYWRQEAQWYIHAYHTVTGVDLSSDMQDVRRAELRPDRYMQPAFHLQRRLVQQHRRLALQRSGDGRALRRGRGLELEQGEVQEVHGEQRAPHQLSE